MLQELDIKICIEYWTKSITKDHSFRSMINSKMVNFLFKNLSLNTVHKSEDCPECIKIREEEEKLEDSNSYGISFASRILRSLSPTRTEEDKLNDTQGKFI